MCDEKVRIDVYALLIFCVASSSMRSLLFLRIPGHLASRFAELQAQLFYLFSTYGKVIDVIAQKGTKRRGQAFIVFRDLAGSTSAMRSLDGELFYDKKMVSYSLLMSLKCCWIT